jgi:hypothetical protein
MLNTALLVLDIMQLAYSVLALLLSGTADER